MNIKITSKEASNLHKAIDFMMLACTNASVETPNDMSLNYSNMKALNVDETDIALLQKFREKLTKK
jgi:hypothetical protein